MPSKLWKPGESGNPTGRKPGTGKVNEYRKLLESRLPELMKVLVDKALAGEDVALKLCLERLIPPYRPEARSVEFTIPEKLNLVDIGKSIIESIGNGTISPDQGAQVLSALSNHAKLVEVTELEQRITALEQTNVN